MEGIYPLHTKESTECTLYCLDKNGNLSDEKIREKTEKPFNYKSK